MSASLRRSIRPRRVLAVAGLTAGVAATWRWVRRRGRLLEPVAADLRSPVLYVPLSIGNPVSLRLVRALPVPSPPVPARVRVEERTIPTEAGHPLRVLIYERPDRARPSGALLWIHGGGLVMGTPEQGNVVCGRWADELDLVVVSVDYRLAPEDPFPAGLEDCYTALSWLGNTAGPLGVDPTRVAVGGDSAGGGLAAALSQLARDRGGPAICFQLLEYPMLDDRTVLRADHEGRGVFIWTAQDNRFGWTAYLGEAPSLARAPRYAAPARTDDLAGLPPAWIGVGDLDLFHDEDVDYARRLVDAGVDGALHVEPGMYHGADSILAGAPTAKRFRDQMTAALAAGLGDPAGGVDPAGRPRSPD